MEEFEKYVVYGVYNIGLLTPLAVLFFFALRRSHRVCRSHLWPRALALSVGLLLLLVDLVPFAVYGSSWATVSFVLVLPFSLVLEFDGIVIPTIVSASFWSAIVYVIAALILRVIRRA